MMSWLYRHFLRPRLFAIDSEEIHNRTLSILGALSRNPPCRDAIASFLAPSPLPVELFGLRFPNPVGLAAGMDKHAAALPAWAALGFGFTELGGITWLPQTGNPPPRIFRLLDDEALINRMGFNNPGAESMARRLREWGQAQLWPPHPVGMNLGKSKLTPLNEAAEDYARSFRALWPFADFFVVNVSSPNTPNLRQLQDKRALDEILAAIQETNNALACRSEQDLDSTVPPKKRPILVKVAPDLSFEALDDILDLVGPRGIDGLVAANTTLARPETSDSQRSRLYAEAGGLSGRPLRRRGTEIVRHLARQTSGKLPLIGVGGIFSAADAWEKITAGASLVQVYTGLIYEGPSLPRRIVSGLQERIAESGMKTLAEAVGTQV